MDEIFKPIISFFTSSLVTALANTSTLTGVNVIWGITKVREYIGNNGIKDLEDKLFKKFPNKAKNPKQEKLLLDSIIELEEFIRNNPNLEENIFKEINNAIVNGIEKENRYLKTYLRILMELTWYDVELLKIITHGKVKRTMKDVLNFYGNKNTLLNFLIEKTQHDSAILEISINKLIEKQLIFSEGWEVYDEREEWGEETTPDGTPEEFRQFATFCTRTFLYYTDIGKKIVELLEDEIIVAETSD